MKFLIENGMYVAIADNQNLVINYGDGYCYKLYRKVNDFSDCTEVEKPVEEEVATEADYINALNQLGVNAYA